MEVAIVKAVASGVLAYSIHYGSIKLYSTLCVPDGMWGYLQGLLTTGSPMCQVALTAASQTQTSYSSLLLVGGSRFFIDMVGLPFPKD